MELELRKETYLCCQALPPVREKREKSQETIVPDYCPDIARIVEGSGCLFLRSRELLDGKVSVTGTLKVTLLYIADGNGGIKSFEYALSLEETLDTRMRDGCGEVYVDAALGALEVRALNPRKIVTRAVVELSVTPYCNTGLVTCGAIAEEKTCGIETLCETQNVSLICALRSKEFVFSDELLLAAGKEAAAELLRRSAQVRVTECRNVGGKIILKGIVRIELLYLSESGTICRADSELPFSQVVDGAEEGGESVSAEAFVHLTGAELRIGGEDGSGDSRTIAVKLFLHAFLVLRRTQQLHCITDLYSVSHDLSFQMQPLELTTAVQTVSQETIVRELVETGVEPASVLWTSVSFSAVSVIREEAALLPRCTALLRILYLDEGGSPLLAERRIELSARIGVPQDCTAAVSGIACGREISAAVTAGGIEVRFPALFTVECIHTHRCACLSSLKAEPRQESAVEQPSLILRALRPNQRLWDLAKDCRTTVSDILSANALSDESDAAVGEMLLIPRGRACCEKAT